MNDRTSNVRVCTCHPTERPPICQHRYGARECQDAYRAYKAMRVTVSCLCGTQGCNAEACNPTTFKLAMASVENRDLRAALACTRSADETTGNRSVTLNGYQLKAALEFVAPDNDPEQLESEVSIQWGDTGHSGSGYYCCMTEYPEEGSILLDDAMPDGAAMAGPPSDPQEILDALSAVEPTPECTCVVEGEYAGCPTHDVKTEWCPHLTTFDDCPYGCKPENGDGK